MLTIPGRVFGKLPLQTVIVVPFVLQIVGTVGLVGYLSFKSGQKAVEELAHQLMEQVGERISDRLTTYRHAPQEVVAANHLAVEQGTLNLNDFEQLRQQFWQQMSVYPSISGSSFWSEQGTMINYARIMSEEERKQARRLTGKNFSIGTRYLSEVSSSHPGERRLYLVDANGKPQKLVYSFVDDFRKLPWYLRAKAARKQTWSAIFVYKTAPILGVLAIAPVYNAAGQLQGFFTSGVTLTNISTFLNKLHFSPSGQTFIMERSGNLVATSTLEIPFVRQAKGQPTRLLARNSKDTRTRDIAQQLTNRFGNLGTLQTTQQLTLVSNHERQFVRVTPYQDKYGLDWLVVVVVPESDFMEQIHANTGTTILLCIAALVGSITVGILTARWISKPIVQLNLSAKGLAKGEWNRTLEAQVVERTAELAQANEQLRIEIAERELIEGKLYSSIQQVRTIFESLSDIVLIIDVKKSIQVIPTKTLGLHTCDTNLLNAIVEQFFQEDTEENWFAKVQQVLETQQNVNFDYSLSINNQEVWLRTCISPLPDNSVVWVARDISARKQAEQALIESEARFQAFMNYSPLLAWISDGDGKLLYCNPSVELWSQRAACELIGETIFALHPPNIAQQHLENIRYVINTRQVLETNESAFILDGTLHEFLTYKFPLIDANGQCLVGGIAADITDRKQAEEALRESANRERAIAQVLQRMRQSLDINTIFNTTTDELRRVMMCDRVAIYQFNPDWSGEFVAESVASGWRTLLLEQNNVSHLTDEILDSENCAVRAWGITNELIEDTYLQATQGSIYSQSDSYVASEDIYNTGLAPCHIELLERFQAKAYLIVPIFCSNKLWGLLASYHNTSARHWSESEINTVIQIGIQLGVALQQAQLLEETRQQSVALQQAAYAADAANRAKSTFLANMSHELRTPLNGILGYAQILQADKNCNPKQQDGINIIYQCGTHLLTLINDILDLSKIEAEKLELYPEEIHFLAYLAEISEIFKLKAVQKDINFTYLPLNPLPTGIHADKKRLRQVLMNLLSNAVKFTNTGGVTFKVARIGNERREQSSITHHPSPITNIRFQVEDTGIGIPPEQLEKIFLPFEQVGDNSRRSEGTGLGLAISQRIVEMMGSKILVESTPGVGSTFWFDLHVPEIVTSRQPMSVKSTKHIIGYSGSRRKILLVDDRWENCAVLRNMLEPIGFELEEATNGQDGLDKAVEFQPDLILADLIMPVMDGFEMMRQLRQLSEFQNTIIIAISANAFEVSRRNSLECGCDDFLSKPVQAEELLEKIKDYLNLSWIYDNSEELQSSGIESSRNPPSSSLEMVIPPSNELLALYEAVLTGNVEGVESESIRLQELSLEYIPFVIRVLELAQNFEYEAIAKLIEPLVV